MAITTSSGFAALWLLPRLGELQSSHPEVDLRVVASNRVLDLERETIDLAVRYCPAEQPPSGAVRLFDEELLPVSSTPVDLDEPAQLGKAVLLDYDDPAHPLLHWARWLRASGAARSRPGRVLRFTQYEQVIQSALAGHGVALGRLALVRPFLDSGSWWPPPLAGRCPWATGTGSCPGAGRSGATPVGCGRGSSPGRLQARGADLGRVTPGRPDPDTPGHRLPRAGRWLRRAHCARTPEVNPGRHFAGGASLQSILRAGEDLPRW